MSMGMVSGETLRSPWVSRMSSWPSNDMAPPMPVPTITASRSGSTAGSSPASPACAHASRAAMIATCSDRSQRRASTRLSTSVGSTASCAAIFTGRSNRSTHSASSRDTPDRPASRASQVDAASPPSGVVAPYPVTTTSVELTGSPRSLVLRDVVHGVAHGLQLRKLVVRDLDAEPVLGLHGDLDHRQRIDVEVVDERLLGCHLGRVDAGDLLDDLRQAGLDLGDVGHAVLLMWGTGTSDRAGLNYLGIRGRQRLAPRTTAPRRSLRA